MSLTPCETDDDSDFEENPTSHHRFNQSEQSNLVRDLNQHDINAGFFFKFIIFK